MTPKILYFFLLILLGFSCSSNNISHVDPSEYLLKANEYHQQSLDLRVELLEMEVKLKEAGIDYSPLKDDLKMWDKDIIEVPGMEHSHDDEHQRKYHVHNPPKQLSDEEHLEYQKMMYDEISEIHQKMVGKIATEPVL